MSVDDGRITAPEGGGSEDTSEILGMLGALRERGGILGMIAGVLSPGVGPGVVLFICSALVLLIALCGVAVLAGYYSFHMLILIVLATGLMGSVVWSYSIRKEFEKEQAKQQREAVGGSDSGEDEEEEEEDREPAGRESVGKGGVAAPTPAPARRSKKDD